MWIFPFTWFSSLPTAKVLNFQVGSFCYIFDKFMRCFTVVRVSVSEVKRFLSECLTREGQVETGCSRLFDVELRLSIWLSNDLQIIFVSEIEISWKWYHFYQYFTNILCVLYEIHKNFINLITRLYHHDWISLKQNGKCT